MTMNQSFTEQIQTPGALSPEELEKVQKVYESILLQTDPSQVAGRIVRTYAEALLDAAEARGQVDAVAEDFYALVYELFPAVPGLEAALDSAAVSKKHKDAMIVGLLEGKATPLFVDFLRVLNEKDRLGYLRLIGLAARAMRDMRANRQRVLVETAAPLSEEQSNTLRETIAAAIHKTPVLVVREKPELIGGLVVHIGDKVFDTSVRTRLTTLRNTLTARGTNAIQDRRDLVRHS